MEATKVSNLVVRFVKKNDNLLIAVLEDVQKYYNYLPEETLREVSKQMDVPLRDVFGVATFYKAFSLKPRGKHITTVCLGTACHVRNSPAIAEEFEKQLGIKAGETTRDNEFTLETVNCLGACALGPIVVADGKYFSSVKTKEVKSIIAKTQYGLEQVDVKKDNRIFPVNVNCPRCNHSLMDVEHPIDGCPSIKVTISFGDNHGWFRLSSLYGSSNIESEHERPLGTKANYFCPHCNSELAGVTECPECGTEMVPMIIQGGGMVYVCPKRGCKGHILDV
ncbi:MAG: hypothetical protein COX07_07855 [Bacteroidetes bacterium CG23_combo_of_CG06-09_8_20_14_all_32_9]|nr:MAG: hypothetical protein COX07_07855 [Bacteroidetes bacterium CG23_combo_of_CG06-09_8_20_14_all_32_9]